jgi:GNAT superfamily N-acetyltransferase
MTAFAMALVYWPVSSKRSYGNHASRSTTLFRAVVQTVVDEIYGGLWAPPPLPIDEDCWLMSWVAVVDTKIVGVVLTHEQWPSDLWVLRDSRGHGIGQRLLARAEAEMVRRGYPPAACSSIERKRLSSSTTGKVGELLGSSHTKSSR